MGRFFSLMIAMLIGITIMTVAFAYQTFQSVEKYSINYINYITLEFSNIIRQKGYISRKMYEDYVYKLALIGDNFNISIKHREYKIYPELNPDGSVKIGEWEEHMFEYPTNYIIDYLYEIDETVSPRRFENDIYKMSVGDSIKVEVQDKRRTGAMVFRNSSYNPINARYGGLIKGEEY